MRTGHCQSVWAGVNLRGSPHQCIFTRIPSPAPCHRPAASAAPPYRAESEQCRLPEAALSSSCYIRAIERERLQAGWWGEEPGQFPVFCLLGEALSPWTCTVVVGGRSISEAPERMHVLPRLSFRPWHLLGSNCAAWAVGSDWRPQNNLHTIALASW